MKLFCKELLDYKLSYQLNPNEQLSSGDSQLIYYEVDFPLILQDSSNGIQFKKAGP